jgi:hypothetical protein
VGLHGENTADWKDKNWKGETWQTGIILRKLSRQEMEEER